METKYQVVALIGKAGAGKDAIQQATCKAHPEIFHSIVSCTTRPPREGEIDGVAYHFLSINDFTRKVLNGDMLEATEFRDWFYGTSIEALDPNKINLGVFNPAGVTALLEAPNINLTVIYIDALDKERLMRYLDREDDPDCAEMCRRYLADEKDFADLDFDYYTYVNLNGCCIDLMHAGPAIETVLGRAWFQIGDMDAFKASRDPIMVEPFYNKDNNE